MTANKSKNSQIQSTQQIKTKPRTQTKQNPQKQNKTKLDRANKPNHIKKKSKKNHRTQASRQQPCPCTQPPETHPGVQKY